MTKISFDPNALALFPELNDPRIQDAVSAATGQLALTVMAAEASILEQVTQATVEFGCSAALDLLNIATAIGCTMPSVAAVLRLQIERYAKQPDLAKWNLKPRSSQEFRDLVDSITLTNASLDASVQLFRAKIRDTIDVAMGSVEGTLQ